MEEGAFVREEDLWFDLLHGSGREGLLVVAGAE